MGKILVILTGGTIGSKAVDGIINIEGKGQNSSPYLLIQEYERQYKQEDKLEVINPVTILSENITPVYWEQFASIINNIDSSQYDGIIFTHGSDTLAYTSSFLGMTFGWYPIPIILIASNYPIEDKRSNGLANFRGAVELIHSKQLKGVYTVYQNNKKEILVYLATRLVSSDAARDQFSSFGGEPFAKIEEGELKVLEKSFSYYPNNAKRWLQKQIYFTSDILVVQVYPGLSFDFFSLDKKPKAVLCYLYHSATMCVKSQIEKYQFLPFAKRCKEKKIPLYLASFKKENKNLYATSAAVLEEHAGNLLYDISLEAAYVKLLLAYNQQAMTAEEFLSNNWYYEHL